MPAGTLTLALGSSLLAGLAAGAGFTLLNLSREPSLGLLQTVAGLGQITVELLVGGVLADLVSRSDHQPAARHVSLVVIDYFGSKI